MRTIVLVLAALAMTASLLHAEWIYVRDLDRGRLPNEFHANIKDVHLTTEHARPGHVALAFTVGGSGWVTRYNLWHNWTWYDRVAFRMFNANDKPLKLHYEVRTRHDRRAAKDIVLQPGENDVVVKFAEMQNLREKPFVLWDVGQWVMSFDEALPKPLYLSEYRMMRENIELPWPTEARLPVWWKTEEATLTSEEEKGDPVPTCWASAAFAAGKTGCVWTELRPAEKFFNTFAFPETWLGYERVTFVCDNPQGAPVKFELLLEDFTARACRDTKYRAGQAAAVALEAKPGKQVLEAALRDLKTIDGSRWLDLAQMYRVGFRVTEPAAATKLRFTDIRIHTSDGNAGVLIPTEGVRKCASCNERLDDLNANCCPFCGKLYNERAVVTAPAANAWRIYPTKDASVMASGGGGDPIVDQRAGRDDKLSVCHYDTSFWEGRAFLRFEWPKVNGRWPAVKKAELRLSSSIAGHQGKSWLCPLRVFAAPDGRDDFDETQVTWLTQPPIGEFASQGGLYYYWTDTLAIDVTDYVKRRTARTKEPFTLILRAFEADPCKENAHLFGHHFPIWSREAKDETKRPYLYVEFE